MAAALDQPAGEVDPCPDLVLARPRGQRRPRASAALAVVPPMSSEIRLGRPVSRPSWPQAMTPAAGPDSTRCAGFRAAIAGGSVPPLDCMISSGASMPASRRRFVSESTYLPTVGPRYALTTAVLVRSYSRTSGRMSAERVTKTSPARLSRRISSTRRSWTSSAYECSSAIATASTRCSAEPRSDVANRALVERHPDLAARAEALAHLEAQRARHERLRLLVLQVVEHRDPEPAHLEHVAKALGRHERHGRAATLEHRVGRDRARVHDAARSRRGRPPSRAGAGARRLTTPSA